MSVRVQVQYPGKPTTTENIGMDDINPELQLANDFVRHTSHNIFLTGKAGTGKTTFLHKLKNKTSKRMIVTAPTGVAAINAGGVTLHSFFQLPFGPFVPGSEFQGQMEQRRFSKEKINIIKSLDLLVIDEISMVRSDLLDSVDFILRRHKHRDLPFGGAQLLMIGDLHQLSPVVKEDEWRILKKYYDSCYFFSSHALRQTEMMPIELKHIYRQSDADFIGLLNCVRNNRLDSGALEMLNARYIPAFEPQEGENYITLTTHNHSADKINNRQLNCLDSKAFSFQAEIEGQYPEHAYPTVENLILKKGAQVMFVRNDNSADKRYYNGKIGKIISIGQEHISVKCPDDGQTIQLEKVSWKNIKYTIDKESKAITEEMIGEFIQYPLRLAWAITIHKSQGLTFERAIIDANAAFSHGQVYVALSRCKTLEGIVLSEPINPAAVKTDATVAKFVEHSSKNPPTQVQLKQAKIAYQQRLLLECFNFKPLNISLQKFLRLWRDNRRLIQFSGDDKIAELEKQLINEVVIISEKFQRQLQTLFTDKSVPEEDLYFQERVRKGAEYFTEKLDLYLAEWTSAIQFETDNRQLRKTVNQAVEWLRYRFAIKIACMSSCREGFSIGLYLETIARAEIDFKSRTPVKKKAVNLNVQSLEHPELFNTLVSWRNDQAEQEEVDRYRILHQRILLKIASVIPDSLDTLLEIKGIGTSTVEKYGTQLVNVVLDYCQARHIDERNLALPEESIKPAAVTTKTDTKETSYTMYCDGKSIEEIARERKLKPATIENHLAHYIGLGKLDIADFVSDEKLTVIRESFVELGDDSLGRIKEKLGDNYSYGELHMVKAYLSLRT